MRKLLFIIFFGASCFYTLSSEETKAYQSTYNPKDSGEIIIEDARILTGTGKEILKGSILISSNKIKAIGENIQKPLGARVINAKGKWVTPGIIDIHSHMGSLSSS